MSSINGGGGGSSSSSSSSSSIYFILPTKYLYQKAHCLFKMLYHYRCGLAYRMV